MAETEREGIIPYSDESDGLADSSDFDYDPANAPGGGPTVVQVDQIVYGGDFDVKFLVDTDGDGTYEINETLDSYTGNSIVRGVGVLLYESSNQVLRITNTSGSAADYSVNGRVLSGVQ